MLIKKTITSLAVDSAKSFLQEKLNELKQLDLDKDGEKDVEQCSVLLVNLFDKLKLAVESTDFQKMATGVEQVMNGAGLIGESIDRQKLGMACEEVGTGLRQLGKLLQLGIAQVKENNKE